MCKHLGLTPKNVLRVVPQLVVETDALRLKIFSEYSNDTRRIVHIVDMSWHEPRNRKALKDCNVVQTEAHAYILARYLNLSRTGKNYIHAPKASSFAIGSFKRLSRDELQ